MENKTLTAENDLKKHIGEQVQKRRKESGFNQESLAEYLGLTRTSVVNIEAGRQGLSYDKFYLLCCFLHCTPNDLYPPIVEHEWRFEEVDVVVYEKVAKTIKVKKLIQ